MSGAAEPPRLLPHTGSPRVMTRTAVSNESATRMLPDDPCLPSPLETSAYDVSAIRYELLVAMSTI